MSLLDWRHTVEPAGYNRWLVPPTALAVYLSIGQVYAFSVLKTPLIARFHASHTEIGIIFSIAIVMLGLTYGVWQIVLKASALFGG